MKKAGLLFLLPILVLPVSLSKEYNTAEVSRIEYSEGLSTNDNLSRVTIQGITFKFDKNVTEYEIDVPYSMEKIVIDAVAEDPKALVQIVGDDDLLVGNNSIAILVTSEANSQKEYDFTINRSENNKEVINDEASIKSGILSGDSTNITAVVTDSAATLSKETLDLLKESGKTLVYEWRDSLGEFVSSLTIDGTKMGSTAEMDPNIKSSISNSLLKKTLKDSKYVALSTMNTNIPEGSVYRTKVTGDEDLYYLYFYEEDRLNKLTLRSDEGFVEFEVKNNTDYAIVGATSAPAKEVEGFSWIWPTVFLIILFIVFFAITKVVMIKVVREAHTNKKYTKENPTTEAKKKE